MFSSSKQLTAPPVELPVGAPVEPVSAPIEQAKSMKMGEIYGERWFRYCGWHKESAIAKFTRRE